MENTGRVCTAAGDWKEPRRYLMCVCVCVCVIHTYLYHICYTQNIRIHKYVVHMHILYNACAYIIIYDTHTHIHILHIVIFDII